MFPLNSHLDKSLLHLTRRHFLSDCASGLGALWFASTAGKAWGASGQLKKDPALYARIEKGLQAKLAGKPMESSDTVVVGGKK